MMTYTLQGEPSPGPALYMTFAPTHWRTSIPRLNSQNSMWSLEVWLRVFFSNLG